jgi:hypothetical protein
LITYIPTGKEYLPYEYWGGIENARGHDFVSFGPNQTGIPLVSGQLFTGFWGGYFQNNEIKIRKLENNEFPRKNFTGTKLNWFGNNLFSSNINRFTNFSMCFDNSGIPVIAFQDNGDSNAGYAGKPEVKVFSLISGSIFQTGWNGESPTLVNSTNLNNYSFVTGRDLEFRTGQFTCFYKKGNLLAKRYGTNRWNREMIVTGVSTSGLDFITKSSFWASNEQSSQKPPSQLLMLSSSKDGQIIKVTSTKKYFNFILEDFNIYDSGKRLFFESGVGKTKDIYYLKQVPGYTKSNKIYFTDGFSSYETGSLTGQSFSVSGFISGSTIGNLSIKSSLRYGETVSGYDTFSGKYIGYIVTTGINFESNDFNFIDFNFIDFY